jgi:hypothetical protein
MKKLLFSLLISTILISCGESNETSTAVNTEIPTELSSNTEVQEYFATLDAVMTEYISMVEEIAKAGKEAESSDGGDFGSAMSMLGSVASSTMKMAPLLEKLEKLEKDGEVMKGEMTGEELVAFTELYASMMMRLMEMGENLED